MAVSMKFLAHAALTLAILGGIGLAGMAGFILGGVYDVAAIHQHTRPVYALLHFALRRAVEVRAQAITVPPLTEPALLDQGLRLYRAQCAQCHGAPGVAREAIGLGMLPLPTNLVETARTHPPSYIYWIVANGIRMTGMPAWQFRLNERELWAVVAFVERLPELAPDDYAAWARNLDSSPGPRP